jgi:hypothetical protein
VTAAALDRLLAVLVVALAATGLLSLRAGAPSDGWLFVGHGLLGGALAVAVAWKVARSMPRAVRARRWGRVALGGLVSLATAAALVGGFAWVASGEPLSIGSWTVLTIHAWIGLALVPVLVIHLLPRRWRLLVPRAPAVPGPRSISRRRLVVGSGIGLASVSLFGAAQLADRALGGERRFTGSRWLPAGGVPPATTFFGEAAPSIDAATWRLTVHGRVERAVVLTAAELEALGEVDSAAVLDCTSGWAIETGWRGTPLSAVLEQAGVTSGAREVVIRSATGWGTVLPLREASDAILARSVAGQPLPVGNGAPCRLVVPDRRGLDWVKWVTEIEVR